jgi:hypothetical protein
MAFEIPNEIDAVTTGRDAEIDNTDIDVLVAGIGGDGVVSGCAVTGVGTLTVTVAAGEVRIGGVNYTVAGNTVAMAAADGTYARYDLVEVNTSGVADNTDGTATAFPVFPDPTASRVVLCAIPRPIGDDAIATADVIDKRVTVRIGGDYTQAPVLPGKTRTAGETGQLGLMGYHDGTTVMDYTSWGSLGAIAVVGVVEWAQAAALFDGVLLFGHTATHRNEDGTAVNGAGVANQVFTLIDAATYQAVNAAYSIYNITGFQHQPTLNESGTGTMTVTAMTGTHSGATVTAGTITTRKGLNVADASGAGAVTTQGGVVIGLLNHATNNTHIVLGGAIPAGDYAVHDTTGLPNYKDGVTTTVSAATPEGAISAPLGSKHHNTSGGAGTSFYVKETGGTGNTGWVGK